MIPMVGMILKALMGSSQAAAQPKGEKKSSGDYGNEEEIEKKRMEMMRILAQNQQSQAGGNMGYQNYDGTWGAAGQQPIDQQQNPFQAMWGQYQGQGASSWRDQYRR